MTNTITRRIQNIFSIQKTPLDVILIRNGGEPFIDKNFFYVTGLGTGLFEGCIALLFPNTELHLFVPPLEADIAEKTLAHIHVFHTKEELEHLLDSFLSNCLHLGMNFDNISYQFYQTLQNKYPKSIIHNCAEAFTKARMIKDKEEQTYIKHACSIADRVLSKISSFIHKGMKEYELNAEINYYLQKYGAQAPAFDTISSFGSNTSLPHYTQGDFTLKQGDFILCDLGARFHHYHSDITRMFVLGSASSKQKDIYKTVRDAQTKALDSIKAGQKASSIHGLVVAYINNSPYTGRFIHSTGHSLGLSVHDGGVGFTETCDIILQPGMVLTVEPGVYIPYYGGVRIEDDIVVTTEGFDFLTTSSRELLEI